MSELHNERRAVQQALISAGFDVIWFEGFGARPDSARDSYLQGVRECDVLLGIYWNEYGNCSEAEISAIEEEYIEARNLRRPCLLYVKSFQPKRHDRLVHFLAEVSKDHTYKTFADELTRQVVVDIQAWVSARLAVTGGAPVESATPTEQLGGALFFTGRTKEISAILGGIREDRRPVILCVDGMGGIGKTALAQEAVRKALGEGLVARVCWKTAKTEALRGPQRVVSQADAISWPEIQDAFTRAKHSDNSRKLFVLDNLESLTGLESVVEGFVSLVGGHVGIITSRERVHWHEAITSISLFGLPEDESLEFLRSDSRLRSVPIVSEMTESRLRRVANLLEGNPLAMKLVVGLATFLPIDSIMDRILAAKMDRRFADGSLYTFIFQHAWGQLTDLAKRVLVYAAKTTSETVSDEELKDFFASSGFSQAEVEDAIAEIIRLCFFDPYPVSRKRRWQIHSLTRHFVTTDLPDLWTKKAL